MIGGRVELLCSLMWGSYYVAQCPSVYKPGKRKSSNDNVEKNLVAMFDDVSIKRDGCFDSNGRIFK